MILIIMLLNYFNSKNRKVYKALVEQLNDRGIR